MIIMLNEQRAQKVEGFIHEPNVSYLHLPTAHGTKIWVLNWSGLKIGELTFKDAFSLFGKGFITR